MFNHPAGSAALYSNEEHWEVSNSTVSLVKSPSRVPVIDKMVYVLIV